MHYAYCNNVILKIHFTPTARFSLVVAIVVVVDDDDKEENDLITERIERIDRIRRDSREEELETAG
jgi:hypothetical protein